MGILSLKKEYTRVKIYDYILYNEKTFSIIQDSMLTVNFWRLLPQVLFFKILMSSWYILLLSSLNLLFTSIFVCFAYLSNRLLQDVYTMYQNIKQVIVHFSTECCVVWFCFCSCCLMCACLIVSTVNSFKYLYFKLKDVQIMSYIRKIMLYVMVLLKQWHCLNQDLWLFIDQHVFFINNN